MAHLKLICIVLFYAVTTGAPPPPNPRFTKSIMNYTITGDGKQSVTFEWQYELVPNVTIVQLSFGSLRDRVFSTAVKKVVQNGNITVYYATRFVLLRKFLPGKDDAIYWDSAVAEELMKLRFPVENDLKAKFTIKNVLMGDKGFYFCRLGLSNGLSILGMAFLNVTAAPSKPPYTPPVSNCRAPSTDDCMGMGYDYTSAESDQGQIAKMKKLYNNVIKKKSECEFAFLDLLCYTFTPKCAMDTKVVYKPCRSVCEAARRKCEYVWIKYKCYGLRWPDSFDCDSLPDDHCFDTSTKRIYEEHCQGTKWSPQCTKSSFVLNVDTAEYGRSTDYWCNRKGKTFGRCKVDVTTIVKAQCEGKKSCSLAVNETLFGNKCPKVNSYLSVSFFCQSPWKPPKNNNTLISWLPLRPCRPLGSTKCARFGYTFTHTPAKPHIASQSVDKYWPVVQSKCSSDLSLLICSVFVPRCNPLNMVTRPPCRSLCSNVKRDCDNTFKTLGMIWPAEFDCASFPDYNCVSPLSKPTDHSSNLIYPRQLTGGGKCQRLTVKECQGLGYQNTILPATFFYPMQSDTEFRLSLFDSMLLSNCSRHLRLFLCSRYAPKCDPSRMAIIPPCRSLCTQIWQDCALQLQNWMIDLRPIFNCTLMPERECLTSLSTHPTVATSTSPTTASYTPRPTFSPFPTSCEPLTISACQNFGYNQTAAAQLLGGAPQSNRSQWLKQMEPLIKTNCSLDLRRFLCSMTAPPCNPDKNTISFPCRSFCERVKQGCGASFKKLTGLDWSSAFDCSVMPQSSCVDPSSRPTVGSRCEKLTIPMCRNIGYTNASFPNNLTHTTQDEAALEMNQYFPLVIAGCSPKLAAFLCSRFAPPCKADKTYLLPCRELCESAKSGCEGMMNNYGFSWPQHLNCDKLPLESTKQCFKGKALPTMPPTSI